MVARNHLEKQFDFAWGQATKDSVKRSCWNSQCRDANVANVGIWDSCPLEKMRKKNRRKIFSDKQFYFQEQLQGAENITYGERRVGDNELQP